MTLPDTTLLSLRDLRALTPARVGLGRTGASLPTQALLEFSLAHARARDAVHTEFDGAALQAALEALGLTTLQVASLAVGRPSYLARPDLGRQLDPVSREALTAHGGTSDLVAVIGDGLSPAAVNHHAVDVLRPLLAYLSTIGVALGPVVVASGARVALGDEIGALLGASMILMLIGERPGLSSPQSLGAYLTFAPGPGCTDADRNCVSNIHDAGLSREEAAFKIGWLVREARTRRVSGVALKDESGPMQNRKAELTAPSEAAR